MALDMGTQGNLSEATRDGVARFSVLPPARSP